MYQKVNGNFLLKQACILQQTGIFWHHHSSSWFLFSRHKVKRSRYFWDVCIVTTDVALSHDVWWTGHLGNTWSRRREGGRRRPGAESTAPWRSRIQSRDSGARAAAKFCSHPRGVFYPRPRPSSTSTTAIWARALSSDSELKKALPAVVVQCKLCP